MVYIRLVPGQGWKGKKTKSLIAFDWGALTGLKTSSELSKMNSGHWMGTETRESAGLQRFKASRMRFRGEQM